MKNAEEFYGEFLISQATLLIKQLEEFVARQNKTTQNKPVASTPTFIAPMVRSDIEKHEKIFNFLLKNPNQTHVQTAAMFNMSSSAISRMALLWGFPSRIHYPKSNRAKS